MALNKVGFGLWSECPDDARAAWGARAILRDGCVDLLHDRQGSAGDDEDRRVFCKRVDAVLPVVLAKVKELCSAWHGMRHDEQNVFVLYEDDGVVVKGDTRASYGYLYIVAYAKAGDAAWDSICNAPTPKPPKPKKVKVKVARSKKRAFASSRSWY